MDERRDKNRIRFAEEEDEGRNEEASTSRSGVARGSFGAWLRTQREARGVTIDAIAETSKISRRYLESLETDRFDALPAPVFVRGFLREYSRIVGLDADEVANFYLHARPSTRERPGDALSEQTLAERRPSRRESLFGYGALLAALLVLFLGIAAAISWWVGGRSENAISSPEAGEQAAPIEPSGSQGAAAGAVPDESSSQPPSRQPSPVSAEAEEPLRVELEFLQDCWVDVVVDGRRRESELKAGGELLVLEADEYILLTLGNAPAVRAEVDGEPYALAREGTRVVRELRIDRATVAERRTPPAASPIR